MTNVPDRDTPQLHTLKRRYYRALILLTLACIFALLLSVLLDVGAQEGLAGLPITSNWLASVLAIPVPVLLSIVLFDKIQRDYETMEQIKARQEVELSGVLPRMAELRGALEWSPFANPVRNATLRTALETLQERIQSSDAPIMLPLEDEVSDALHEIETMADETQLILDTAEKFQEELQRLFAFDLTTETREAVDAVAASLGGLRQGLPTPSEQEGNIARLGRLLEEQKGEWDGHWVKVDSGGFRVELRDLVNFTDLLSRCAIRVEQVLSAMRKLQGVMRI